VICTSDNGPETLNRYRSSQRSFGSPGPLCGMKLYMYEGGIRVPRIHNEMTQFELYNLAEDIAEHHNLVESEPKRLEAMKKTLAQLHAEVDAEGPKWD